MSAAGGRRRSATSDAFAYFAHLSQQLSLLRPPKQPRRRFTSSDDPVRHSGLDVTVWQSDRKRASGHLSHQGPSLLRWALFEAAQCAARRSSPDHAYYLQVAKRSDHNRACLSVARKLCRRAHHILRELGDDALAPPGPDTTRLINAAA